MIFFKGAGHKLAPLVVLCPRPYALAYERTCGTYYLRML
jgi:hypothetical protein